MKKFIHFLLTGLVAAGLASCTKMEFKSANVGEIYAVEIEEDILQTKSSAIEIENGSERTFYATLRKSSDGGLTWNYVNHSNWTWISPTNCSIKSGSQNNNDTKHGVTAGSVVIIGNNVSTKNLTVKAGGTPSGDISKNVAVDVTARKYTVTFNFTPNTGRLLTLMQNKYGTNSGSTGKSSVSFPVEVTDGSGNALGSASFAAFYQYTVPSRIESIKSMSSVAKQIDERVLSLQVKIDEGKQLVCKFPQGGKIAFPNDGDNITDQTINVSQGASSKSYSSFPATYRIDAVNSDLTINVTTPN